MYSSGDYQSDYIMSLHIQEELEDLMFQYKVDLAIWGHYHSYERTCSVYKQQCLHVKATVHTVIGMAGMDIADKWMPKPQWSIYRDSIHFGLAIIETNSTHLHFKYTPNETDDPLDEFWIKNSHI